MGSREFSVFGSCFSDLSVQISVSLKYVSGGHFQLFYCYSSCVHIEKFLANCLYVTLRVLIKMRLWLNIIGTSYHLYLFEWPVKSKVLEDMCISLEWLNCFLILTITSVCSEIECQFVIPNFCFLFERYNLEIPSNYIFNIGFTEIPGMHNYMARY